MVMVSIVREPALLPRNRPSHHDVTLPGLERNLHHCTLLQSRRDRKGSPNPVCPPLQGMAPETRPLGLLPGGRIEPHPIVLHPQSPLSPRRRETDGNRLRLGMT